MSRDPKDDHYLALCKEVEADFLITGDKDLPSIMLRHLTKMDPLPNPYPSRIRGEGLADLRRMFNIRGLRFFLSSRAPLYTLLPTLDSATNASISFFLNDLSCKIPSKELTKFVYKAGSLPFDKIDLGLSYRYLSNLLAHGIHFAQETVSSGLLYSVVKERQRVKRSAFIIPCSTTPRILKERTRDKRKERFKGGKNEKGFLYFIAFCFLVYFGSLGAAGM